MVTNPTVKFTIQQIDLPGLQMLPETYWVASIEWVANNSSNNIELPVGRQFDATEMANALGYLVEQYNKACDNEQS